MKRVEHIIGGDDFRRKGPGAHMGGIDGYSDDHTNGELVQASLRHVLANREKQELLEQTGQIEFLVLRLPDRI